MGEVEALGVEGLVPALGSSAAALEISSAGDLEAILASPPFPDEISEPVATLRRAIANSDPAAIEAAGQRLVEILRKHPPINARRFERTEDAVAKLRDVIRKASSNNADEAYRPTKLHLSGGETLEIPKGISTTTPLPSTQPSKVPSVLFFNHSPPWSNGSGTYSKAMARHVASMGGKAAILFLGPRLDPSLEIFQYLLPFRPSEGEPLDGSAKALMPVILSNPTNPTGTKIRDLPEPAVRAYIEGIADALAAAARHMHADVIVANHAMVGAEAARRTGLPYVVVCHGSCMANVQTVQANLDQHAPSFLAATLQGVLSAGRITTLTDDARDEFARVYGVVPDRITTIPNGFDADLFVKRPDLERANVLRNLGIDPTGITHLVSYHGRMDERKGIPDLLTAAQMVNAQMPGVHFVLAGGGTLLEHYKQMAKDLGVEAIVHFIGHRPPAILVELDNVSNLGVLVSHDEPFGIAALEAAGTGTPVVATNVGGLRKFVTPDFGVLVEPRSPDQIADAILDALRTDLKGRIGEKAADHVHQHHTWAASGDLLLEQVRLAIQAHSRR